MAGITRLLVSGDIMADMDDKEKAKQAVVSKVRAKKIGQDKLKSIRTRRRAMERFTDLKATGKLSKDAKFEDIPDQKFFGAAEDISDAELDRKIMGIARDQSKKMSGKEADEKRKKIYRKP